MKKYLKNILLVLSLSIFVFYFTIRKDVDQVLATLSYLSVSGIFIIIIAFLLVVITETLMYYVFAKKYCSNYTFFDALKVQQTGYFGNAVTPFASGGQVFQALIYKKQGISYDQSGHMLYIFFIINQISIILFALIALIFGYGIFVAEYFVFFNFFMVAFLINTTVILGMFLLSHYKRAHDFITKTVLVFLNKVRIVKDLEKATDKIESTLVKFRSEFKNKDLYVSIAPKLIVFSILRFILFYSMPFVATAVLSGQASLTLFVNSFLVTAFIYNIVGLIPIPGASGGIEGMFLILFTNSNVFPDTFAFAISATILWRVITYYLPLMTGAVVFSMATNSKSKMIEGDSTCE